MSCYAPQWVKKDTQRFPRARTSSGKPLEILSAFSSEVVDADLKAFRELVNHIKLTDKDNTVIMIQVENEIGMLEEPRDFAPQASSEFEKGVPAELMNYLIANKKNLHPTLLEKWNNNGGKTEGTWYEVFGNDIYTDEYFMAWNYANYVEKLAKMAKENIDLPLYVNAALNSRGRVPGEYPSAGPLAHLKDFWKAGAPSIDFLSPDIYDTGFRDWVKQYHFADNILFIPEAKRDLNNGAQAYYVFGHHKALGFSPFSFENGNMEYDASISRAYSLLRELMPYLNGEIKTEYSEGLLFDNKNKDAVFIEDSTRITFSHFFTLPWDPRAADIDNWPETGAIFIKLAPDEYLLAGTGVVAKFEDVNENINKENLGEDGFLLADSERTTKIDKGHTPRVGLASVEEVKINPDGSLTRIRSFNGDETHQGRHARIGVDDHKILHIRTYRYQ